jgi:2-polyprenyl-3-methyl-5-hydroxy-6-metoxy-1,4-benzoquinol methylase
MIKKSRLSATSKSAKPAKKAVAPTPKAAKKAAAPVAKPVKAAAVPAKPATAKSALTPEQRYRMIQEAAYYIAERKGFVANPAEDWAEAEAQIDAKLRG